MLNYKVLGILALTVGSLGLILGITLFSFDETIGYKPDFGIVVDAGSSHTGFILYKWSGEKKHCTGLVEQIAECTAEGGLAGIDPSNITGYFDPCFHNISNHIDSKKPTPVFMGATAGMRLLNLTKPDVVAQLFDSFESYIKNSNGSYQLMQASIISGSDEGLFSWVTANHLMNNLLPEGSASKNTCAMLDMGGASAQIAYEINQTPNPSPPVETVTLYGVRHDVRSSSNLCFGVDQARLRLYALLRLLIGPKHTSIENPCSPIGSAVNISRTELDGNPCVKTKASLDFLEEYYTFEGTSRADLCTKLTQQMFVPSHCDRFFYQCPTLEPTSAIDSTSIVALSSYFYSTTVLNLSDSGSILKDDFVKQSNQYCSLNLTEALAWKNVSSKYAELYCFQLKYIEATLTEAYKLTTNWSNIVFREKIGSSSLGWSLGLMINATNAIPSEAVTEKVMGSASFSFMTIICIGIIGLAGYFFYRMRSRHNFAELLQDGLA